MWNRIHENYPAWYEKSTSVRIILIFYRKKKDTTILQISASVCFPIGVCNTSVDIVQFSESCRKQVDFISNSKLTHGST